MKVKLPLVIDDPYTTRTRGFPLLEYVQTGDEEFFLDGPITRRLAVLDFDPETGALLPGCEYMRPNGAKPGAYRVPKVRDLYSPSFIQANVFSTILQTIYMFEERDALGRKLKWGFDGPQLFVVPRAGEWANAFYERDSRSIQFFYISGSDRIVYTSLSCDVIAHEAAHAILDGIAPTLYHSIAPQSLALHEAVADLTALLMAFRRRTLRANVLNNTEASVAGFTAFTDIATEFAYARDPEMRDRPLRSLDNEKTLNPNDVSVDRFGNPNLVRRDEPHALSEVLTGALFKVFEKIYYALRKENPGQSSGWALVRASEQLKRMTLRALDYLPPGEVSFSDFGRAVLAADQAAHPNSSQVRRWLRYEFLRRAVTLDSRSLRVRTNFEHKGLEGVDLETLIDSDWAAYEFANRNRRFLRIPGKTAFHVYPRLDSTKYLYHKQRARAEPFRELIFKVSWDVQEPNNVSSLLPKERVVRLGTTLVIDWEKRKVRSRLTSDSKQQQRSDRDAMIRSLLDDGVLRIGEDALGPDGKPLCSAVIGECMNGLLHISGTARLLHIAEVV